MRSYFLYIWYCFVGFPPEEKILIDEEKAYNFTIDDSLIYGIFEENLFIFDILDHIYFYMGISLFERNEHTLLFIVEK